MQPATLGDRVHSSEGGPFIVSIARHHAANSIASHSHCTATATILLRGDYFEECGSIRQSLAPLHGVIKPAGELHANHIGARGARSLVIETEHNEWARFFAEPALLERPELAPLILSVAREVAFSDPSSLVMESLIAEWLTGVAVVIEERALPRWLVRIREMIHSTSTEQITLASLAHEVGLHPMYVARTFRKFFQRSIGEYTVALRLARAAQLLVDGREHVGTIALRAGYYDHSHMTRDFRARTGMSPSDWRTVSAA